MPQCPLCTQQPPDDEKLKIHLVRTHHVPEQDVSRVMKGSGWFENKQQTRDGEYKAPEHQAAAYRVQMQKEKPLTVPLIMKEEKKEPTLAAGWKRTTEGYQFEEQIHEKQTPENIYRVVLRARLTPNHGEAIIYNYDKDISALSEMREKEGILDAKMAPLLPSDPKFVTMAEELHDTIHKVRDLKKTIEPDIYTETALDEYFHGVFGSDEHVKWQTEFMQKTLTKVAELKKMHEKTGRVLET